MYAVTPLEHLLALGALKIHVKYNINVILCRETDTCFLNRLIKNCVQNAQKQLVLLKYDKEIYKNQREGGIT